jgi:UDP-N-acetylglucosamine 4-epimerase
LIEAITNGLKVLNNDPIVSKLTHGPDRAGDVKHSLADITKANNLIGYKPLYSFAEGIKQTVVWYKERLNK